MTVPQVILTCEHGGNRVPARYRKYFAGHEEILATHRGYDPGALSLARRLCRKLKFPLVASSTVTRLLVDLNRSLRHPTLFSEWTRELEEEEKRRILERYYFPHREKVFAAVESRCRKGRVLHLSIHSFTPVLGGEVRNADLALLFDPSRRRESRFSRRWKEELRRRAPSLRIRLNYPYRGNSDGLTTALRRRFPPSRYLGIELEVNQIFWSGPRRREWRQVQRLVEVSLQAVLKQGM